MINYTPNSIHPTLTFSIIFKGTNIDLNFQKIVPFGSYAALYNAKKLITKINPMQIMVSYFTDDTTSNMTAGIPGRNNVAIMNKYTIIKASPSDFGLQDNKNIIPSHIPDFINLPSCSQEGAQSKSICPQESATPKSIQTHESRD